MRRALSLVLVLCALVAAGCVPISLSPRLYLQKPHHRPRQPSRSRDPDGLNRHRSPFHRSGLPPQWLPPQRRSGYRVAVRPRPYAPAAPLPPPPLPPGSGSSPTPAHPRSYLAELGIRFDYVSSVNGQQIGVLQQGDKVYVYASSIAPAQGQWVQVFQKPATQSLEDAIQAQVLRDILCRTASSSRSRSRKAGSNGLRAIPLR